MRVLIVENEHLLAESLKTLLKTCRASVFTLCSPRKGWLRLTS